MSDLAARHWRMASMAAVFERRLFSTPCRIQVTCGPRRRSRACTQGWLRKRAASGAAPCLSPGSRVGGPSLPQRKTAEPKTYLGRRGEGDFGSADAIERLIAQHEFATGEMRRNVAAT